MQATLVAGIISGFLFAAIWLGRGLRRLLPEQHLTAETKEAVKLAVGMVATMSALLLGLLVSSAKGSYDTVRGEVLQMAAKVAFMDRVLQLYGPEAAEARRLFRSTMEDAVRRIWPEEAGTTTQLAPNTTAGDAVYIALQQLSPRDDMQRGLKAQALSLGVEIAQLHSLLQAQSVSSISKPMLSVVVCWLVIIFLSFSLLAPQNATAILALLVSAFSVAGAVLLIMELDHPFGGLIRISSEPMQNALKQAAK
jgi:hypothetical protein